MGGVFNKSSVFNKLGLGLVVIFFLSSASMEMASSTISDLRPFVRRRDFLPGVNGGVGGLNFSRYGPSDLASPDQF